MRSSHLALVVVCLLMLGANSLSDLTYSYYFNDTVDPTSNSYYFPSYNLGTLSVNYTLEFTFNVPSSGITFDPSEIQLFYINAGAALPAETSAGALNIASSGALDSAGKKFTLTYPIFFADSTITSAVFKLLVASTVFDPSVTSVLTYLNIQVRYFNSTSGQSPTSGNPPATLLKVTETFRQTTLKFFYVGSKTKISFSFFPITFLEGNPFAPELYAIGPATASNDWAYTTGTNLFPILTNQEITANAAAADPVFPGSVGTYTTDDLIEPGYYLLRVPVDVGIVQSGNIRFRWQTDNFKCPFDSSFGDYYQNFQGCTAPISEDGAPCASYNSILGVCQKCIDGYFITNGSCLANTTCPDRQYFNFGKCYAVNSLCGDFDKFTGACLTCSDSANYYLLNGSCLHRSVTCANRQYQLNYTCYNVSEGCDTFDAYSGKCYTCISKFYQLNADGTCTKIVVKCPPGQYVVELSCVTIPTECLNFDTTLGKCLSCVQGYYVENGVCKRIVCPDGQVPSKYGIFCTNVSPLCNTYDQLSGDCLSCKNPNHSVRNGQCLQIVNGLAGCQERQKLGYGECVNPDTNCKTFDLVSNNCVECESNYYIDFTGRCALKAKCGANQWSVNGDCLGIPDNCLRVDDLGLCTSCITSDYRLQQGQCVFFKTCKGQQYLNSAGQCVDVSPNCATWNPSNGQCITCKIADTQPTRGVCCPAGQVISGGVCVDANTLQKSYQTATGSSCLVPHPALNHCLKCAQNFTPDYTVPYGCTRQ